MTFRYMYTLRVMTLNNVYDLVVKCSPVLSCDVWAPNCVNTTPMTLNDTRTLCIWQYVFHVYDTCLRQADVENDSKTSSVWLHFLNRSWECRGVTSILWWQAASERTVSLWKIISGSHTHTPACLAETDVCVTSKAYKHLNLPQHWISNNKTKPNNWFIFRVAF